MARVSKFKVGRKVSSKFTCSEVFEVIEVRRNTLRVKPYGDERTFVCQKNLFEVVEDEFETKNN